MVFVALVAGVSLVVGAVGSASSRPEIRSQPTRPRAGVVDAAVAVSGPAVRGVADQVRIVVGPPPDPLPSGSAPGGALNEHELAGQAALARVPYPWADRLAGWTIEFHPPRPRLRGITRPAERRIEVYVHTADVFELAAVVAHELGHAVDLVHNDTGARRRWKAARGIGANVAWWPQGDGADFDTGSGDFAECFASWQLGSPSRSTYGRCSRADRELMAELAG